MNNQHERRDESKEDNAYIQRAEEKETIEEQIKSAFYFLENEGDFDNPAELLRYTMEKLEAYLHQRTTLHLKQEDFSELSSNLDLLELPIGRIFSYRGRPEIFGESSDSSYSFLQHTEGKEIKVYPLFQADTRQIHEARQFDELIILTGTDMGGRPRQAFADRVSIQDNTLGIESALEPFADGKWEIKEGSDSIMRVDHELTETYLADFTADGLTVSSNDGEILTLKWNPESNKMRVAKQPVTTVSDEAVPGHPR
ncbi:hypothetical protein [Paenibacillus sambharensis]|uniref:hypothetical protein n=1 Tax=Paenibacillus sambharensis TaxID=1803190 RepID=UPI0011B848E2|nr:hypothetical protein [Paenibacillus sambharensis]